MPAFQDYDISERRTLMTGLALCDGHRHWALRHHYTGCSGLSRGRGQRPGSPSPARQPASPAAQNGAAPPPAPLAAAPAAPAACAAALSRSFPPAAGARASSGRPVPSPACRPARRQLTVALKGRMPCLNPAEFSGMKLNSVLGGFAQ